MTAGPVDAVVLAAGGATRMGGEDKLLAQLGDAPLIVWSLRAFERAPEIRNVVVTTSPANRDQIVGVIRAARLTKVARVVLGGASRAESVLCGLETLADGGAALVAVHDGARPFVTPAIIARGIEAARVHGAAVAAVPSVDTVKLVTPAGRVERTLPREHVWLAQTPQIGHLDALLQAHRRNRDRLAAFTDDVALLEHEGVPVHVFESDAGNVKITRPADLSAAQTRVAAGPGYSDAMPAHAQQQ